MAVVLSSEDSSYFSPSSLRRSQSQPKFSGKQSPVFHSSASTSRISDASLYAAHPHPAHNVRVFGDVSPSSAPSSPTVHAESNTDLSCSSTTSSELSLTEHDDCEDDGGEVHDEDEDTTITIGRRRLTEEEQQLELHHSIHQYEFEDPEPPASPGTGPSYTPSEIAESSTNTSRPDSPEVDHNRAEDDTAVKAQPSRHVDYLSHNWKEEDIWMSWKYVISRREAYSNAARLENASWRTWMKAKNKLKTVSPETLNWLKDCDVTWLYGPLQTGTTSIVPSDTGTNSGKLSKSNSFVAQKKPILKKRSVSELMLQRSLSASSLLKQAAAAVQAQQKDGRRLTRPTLDRAHTDFGTFTLASRRLSHATTSLLPSASSSGVISPTGERRHIHFNEQVEQCIAVDVKGEDEDELNDGLSDSDSDDGAIMMKPSARSYKRMPLVKKKAAKPSASSNGSATTAASTESKTIAMLPSTTLKYRDDSAESETAMKHSFRSPVLSPSSSQETLKPSKQSGRFSFGDDEDEDEDDDEEREEEEADEAEEDEDSDSAPPRLTSRSTSSGGLLRSASSSSLGAEPAGMRRTSSARDIAHVIWNVGWRK